MDSTSLRQVRGWELDHVKSEVDGVKSKQIEHDKKLADHEKLFAGWSAALKLSVGIVVIAIPLLTTMVAWIVLEVASAKVTIEKMEVKK